jgi:hypothetical protein
MIAAPSSALATQTRVTLLLALLRMFCTDVWWLRLLLPKHQLAGLCHEHAAELAADTHGGRVRQEVVHADDQRDHQP